MELGGAQVLTVGLLNEMCKKNTVSLVILNNRWNDELLSQLDARIKIYYINRQKGNRSIIPIIRLNILLYKLKADIIHCHEPNMAKLIRVAGPKLFQTIHDVSISTKFYELYYESIAISASVYNDVTSRWDRPVKLIHNGININAFKRRTSYTLQADKTIRLVQVSRLVHEKKGQDILIRAIEKIVYQYGYTNCYLDLVGSGESYDWLQNLITSLNLNKHVQLLGEQDRNWVADNLHNYHILIQPSRYEGFGLTIIEGFAAGLPVLASNIDGPAEIIDGLPGGFLFKNEDVNDCANVLYDMILQYGNNKGQELMAKTIPVIESKYSMSSCANSYVAEYESAVQVRKKRQYEM
jgi:glycosyltransferase involved in cell wall biosynthesis